MAEDQTDEARAGQPRAHTPLLEWLVAGLGAGLVLATLGFLIQHSQTRDQTPPAVRVEPAAAVPVATGFLVAFTAYNDGDTPAAQIPIEGVLVGAAGPAERAEITLDLLPARSEMTGGLFFSRAPEAGELTVRALGFTEP